MPAHALCSIPASRIAALVRRRIAQGGERLWRLDDFRRLELVRRGRKQTFRSRFRQDKGHRAELAAFFSAIRDGGQPPISFENIVSATLATLRAVDSRACGRPVIVDSAGLIASRSNSYRSA